MVKDKIEDINALIGIKSDLKILWNLNET